ncbi:MAG: hypothetical protein AAF367_07105 [Pseudomonadota bacterium]
MRTVTEVIQQAMQRFVMMFLRRFAMRAARKGIGKALSAGSNMAQRKKAEGRPVIDQAPTITASRRRFADERRGDEILYPTDDFTHDMQPRK